MCIEPGQAWKGWESTGVRIAGQGRSIVDCKCDFIVDCYTLFQGQRGTSLDPQKESATYFSSSLSFSTSKVSSQPTSIKTLTPPSSSSNDCEADDSDCAPSREVNVNMVFSRSSYQGIWLLEEDCRILQEFEASS